MGLGMQLIGWPDELVQHLVSRGFRVIRIDNRDAGLSQGFDHLGVPKLAPVMLRHLLHLPVPAPYGLADMAGDALGVLDALGIAARPCLRCLDGRHGRPAPGSQAPAPRQVSLTLMMTTSGARRLPQPALKMRRALLPAPRRPRHRPSWWRTLSACCALIGSPGYPPDPERLRARLQAAVQRAWRPAGTARQLVAVIADGDRSPLAAAHRGADAGHPRPGRPAGPGGRGARPGAKIRGAVVDIVPGMGHDLPLQLLPRLAGAIADNAHRA